ncbi:MULTISPECIES: nucleoside deaminase [unclassified Aureimonas]|uniref:nucleoside deaminase n=1 Tax=unclassified Aureimonas TaxID=2615206 RepID=UPI0006FD771E|nr:MULTISPECIES: nucleoside deaminase [unclassified Aureimonas]KQT64389.1 cytosine deaminase [Aureimonas sp. Leaf427]KQT81580.1 cytosine deaminase [Aureimonas sp. Leaf460]
MYEERFMRRAIELSAEAMTRPKTEPFGCVVVEDGAIVGEGLNHSLANLDPTSHGEVEAIRDACRRLGRVDLTGCELYTSCEPCALCVATMNIVGISRLYYAASMDDAGKAFDRLGRAERHPIDVDLLRSEAGATVDRRATPAEQHLGEDATRILSKWASARKAD